MVGIKMLCVRRVMKTKILWSLYYYLLCYKSIKIIFGSRANPAMVHNYTNFEQSSCLFAFLNKILRSNLLAASSNIHFYPSLSPQNNTQNNTKSDSLPKYTMVRFGSRRDRSLKFYTEDAVQGIINK